MGYCTAAFWRTSLYNGKGREGWLEPSSLSGKVDCQWSESDVPSENVAVSCDDELEATGEAATDA